jgi:hypothetical protein
MERRVTRMGIAHSRVHGSGSPANPGIAKTVFLTGAIVELTGPILRGIERPDTGIIRLNNTELPVIQATVLLPLLLYYCPPGHPYRYL